MPLERCLSVFVGGGEGDQCSSGVHAVSAGDGAAEDDPEDAPQEVPGDRLCRRLIA